MNLYQVVGIIVLVTLIAVAISVITQTRRVAIQNEILPEDELSHFQRMRDAGDISEEEYRKMKMIIAEKAVERARSE